MKIFIVIFFYFFLLHLTSAKTLIIDSASKITNDQVFNLNNGMKIIAFNLEGHTKNNLGYYGQSKCNGIREMQYDKLLKLNVFCEIIFQDGSKIWSKSERSGELNQAGVGRSIFIDASSKLKSLIGTECIYAVNKVLNSDFFKAKCKISEEIFNKLKIQ